MQKTSNCAMAFEPSIAVFDAFPYGEPICVSFDPFCGEIPATPPESQSADGFAVTG